MYADCLSERSPAAYEGQRPRRIVVGGGLRRKRRRARLFEWLVPPCLHGLLDSTHARHRQQDHTGQAVAYLGDLPGGSGCEFDDPRWRVGVVEVDRAGGGRWQPDCRRDVASE